MKKALKYKMFLWTGMFYCAFSALSAQTNIQDSILHLLDQISSLPDQLEKCVREARKSPDSIASIYIREGISIANELNDPVGLAKILTEQAIISNINGDHFGGAKTFHRIDSIYQTLNDSILIAGAKTNLGLSYYHGGAYDQALIHYFDAFQIYDQLEPSKGYSRLLNNLAMTYKNTGKLEEAEQFYQKSIDIKKNLGDQKGVANTMHNKGLLLNQMGKQVAAVQALDSAILIYQQIQDIQNEASTRVALGKILKDNGQLERAIPVLQSGYDYFKTREPGSRNLLLVAGDLAELHLELGQWDRANQFMNEALILAYEHANDQELATLLSGKARLEYERGRYPEAYVALKEANVLRDSVNEKSRISLIEEMQTRFSVREKEKDLQIARLGLENEKRTSRVYRTGLLFTIIVTVLIGLLGYFLFRSRLELQQKNAIIQSSLKEKELLLKEIHHRVKNNLQVISSLLSMQSYQISDPKALDAVREGKNRVKSMALIHQNLYQDVNLVGVNSITYIGQLTRNLFNSYNIDPDRISLETRIDPVNLDVDVMIPLGLILNELITNALKYAFQDGREGKIEIRLKEDPGQILLTVSDNGIGIPEQFDIEKADSMGFLIVKDFCHKLKAKLKIERHIGTQVKILIPNKEL